MPAFITYHRPIMAAIYVCLDTITISLTLQAHMKAKPSWCIIWLMVITFSYKFSKKDMLIKVAAKGPIDSSTYTNERLITVLRDW